MKPFTPRPYQTLAIDYLIENPRCALFVFMGAGKTSVTLLALDRLSLVEEVYPVLVVAPLRVARSTWSNEVKKWNDLSHLRVSTVVGDAHERSQALTQKADVYTINYENLPWLIEVCAGKWPFKTIVVDESSKLKNFRGSIQTSKTGKKFIRTDTGVNAGALAKVAFKSRRLVALTGTPCAKGLENLWAQLFFLDGGKRLGGTFGAFEQRYFRPSFNGYGLEAMPFAQEQIREQIADICMTLDPADWFDIEAPIQRTITVDMPPKAKALYDAMEEELYIEISGSRIAAMNSAACSMKCLQLANGAAYTDPDHSLTFAVTHDEKLSALDEIVDQAYGMPIIVAYNFKSDLARLQKAFPKGRALKSEKDEVDFKAGKIPLLFVHPASAGHGIDEFQYVCNTIVFFGHWWDLELRLQVIERIGPVRQLQAGFKRPVFIYDIVARDTVDELVLVRHETKRSTQDILLESLNRKRGVL